MDSDIINHIFYKLGRSEIKVTKVGPQISVHLYFIKLDNYEASEEYNDLYPEYDKYNNIVYLNDRYSCVLFE
jgi:hypothetical protein